MNKHDVHQDHREKHKAESQAAMARETTPEGRAAAFCRVQIGYLKGSVSKLTEALKNGMSVDEAAAIINADIEHYESNVGEIAAGIAHGVKA